MTNIISALKTKSLIESGAQLVDVRSEKEYQQGAIPGALNLPVNQLEQHASTLDTNKPIIVYCRTGGRSATAQLLLKKIGFQEVHNAGALDNVLCNDCEY